MIPIRVNSRLVTIVTKVTMVTIYHQSKRAATGGNHHQCFRYIFLYQRMVMELIEYRYLIHSETMCLFPVNKSGA